MTSLRTLVRNTLANTPAYPLAKEVYRRLGPYAAERRKLMDFYRPLLRPGAKVFDVGANRGNFTDAYLRLGLEVYAIEPNPVCLREMEALYGHKAGFRVVPCGLGSEPGKLALFLGENGMDNVSTMSKDYIEEARKVPQLSPAGWSRSIQVEVETMDRLIERYGVPDFVKIDVEGFEIEVMKGMSRHVSLLQFEYQPWSPAKTCECIDYLAQLGPCEFNLTMSATREDTGALNDWVSEKTLRELLRTTAAASYGDVFCRRANAEQ